jgi:hypothetical protein
MVITHLLHILTLLRQVDRHQTVRAVMHTYAHGRAVMTHAEFMALAEAILQEYEFMQRFALVRLPLSNVRR